MLPPPRAQRTGSRGCPAPARSARPRPTAPRRHSPRPSTRTCGGWRLERFVSKSSEGSDQSGRSPASAAASRLHSSAPASICVTDLPNPTQNLTVSPRRQQLRRQQQQRRQELVEQEQRKSEMDMSLVSGPYVQEIPHHPSIPFPKDPRNPLNPAVESVKLKLIKKYE